MNNEDQIRPVEESSPGKVTSKKTKKTAESKTIRKRVIGTPFKKGNKVGRKGRSKTDPEIRALQTINQSAFIETATKYLNMPYRKWKERLEKVKDLPGWDAIFLSGLIKIKRRGDLKTFDKVFLDRLIGATKKVIEIGGSEEEESKIISPKRTKDALLALDKVIVDHKN